VAKCKHSFWLDHLTPRSDPASWSSPTFRDLRLCMRLCPHFSLNLLPKQALSVSGALGHFILQIVRNRYNVVSSTWRWGRLNEDGHQTGDDDAYQLCHPTSTNQPARHPCNITSSVSQLQTLRSTYSTSYSEASPRIIGHGSHCAGGWLERWYRLSVTSG